MKCFPSEQGAEHIRWFLLTGSKCGVYLPAPVFTLYFSTSFFAFWPLCHERVEFQAHEECLAFQPVFPKEAILWVSRASLLLLVPTLAPAPPWGAQPLPPNMWH